MKKKHIFRVLTFAFIILLLSACAGGSNEAIVREKLEDLARDDLSVILDGIDPEALLDEPYFEIVSFYSYDEGVFRFLAEVHFFFLKDMNLKIVRRYRYNRRHLRWERFSNVFERF